MSPSFNSHVPHQNHNGKVDHPNPPLTTLVDLGNDWSYATEELLEALPRPWTRGLLYLLMAFVAIALPWSMLYEVEMTGVARGRLEPEEDTIKVEAPLETQFTGVRVKTVHIREGDNVKAGESLIELDSESLQLELKQAQAKLETFQNSLFQLKPVEQQLQVLINTQRLQNQAQTSEQQSQIDQTKERLSSLKSQSVILKSRLERANKDLQRHQELLQEGVIPKRTLEEIESKYEEQKISIEEMYSQIQQAESELSQRRSAYERVKQTGQLAIIQSEQQLQQFRSQIAEVQGNIKQTKSQIQSIENQLRRRIIKAPINGIVYNLPISKSEAVISAGDLLAEIAPNGNSFVLRAEMGTQESGSLQKGMEVNLKFDAYPYQDYGVVKGELLEVSPTSNVKNTAQGDVASFKLKVGLKQKCIQTEGSCVDLKPGETAAAEVIIRRRKVIDFVIDPFKKLQQGGIKF
uniref:AprE-like beta-barrel domain-containing protein n=1 Tax=Nostoc sp. PCC 9201 TaxID=2099382 RepID=A0A2P0ZGN1_9NOSO|nr:hypothetical protein [Nostoc sp. PCC 9201]